MLMVAFSYQNCKIYEKSPTPIDETVANKKRVRFTILK